MAPRLVTVMDPSGSRPTTLTSMPEPAAGESIDLAYGWQHVRSPVASRGLGRNVNTMSRKVNDLVRYLYLPDIGVLDEALVRSDEGSRSVFTGVDIQGSTHYWTVRGSIPTTRIDTFNVVTFVTGCCLFSAPAVQVETTDGGLFDMVGEASTAGLKAGVKSIRVAKRLTAYELESCERHCWTISQFLPRLATSGGPRVRAVLDIPRTQYYLYALDGALNGLISLRQCLNWFNEVDARCEQVVNLYRTRLTAMLGMRKVEISVSGELGHLTKWLREQFTDAKEVSDLPSVRDVVFEQYNVGTKGDRLWKMLQWQNLPDSVVDFNGRCYSAALLREALSTGTSRRLAFEVDNPQEALIADGVADVARGHPHLEINYISVLPIESFTALRLGKETTGKPAMYQNDPGHLLVRPDGTEVTMEEMLPHLFPTRSAA